MDFPDPLDHREKLKECEKRDKYIDLHRGLTKLWSMKVTIKPIVIGDLGTVTKGLLKGLEDFEIRGRAETIQTTALLKSASILSRRLEETRCHSNSSERPSAYDGEKNSQKRTDNYVNVAKIRKKLWNSKVIVTEIPMTSVYLGVTTLMTISGGGTWRCMMMMMMKKLFKLEANSDTNRFWQSLKKSLRIWNSHLELGKESTPTGHLVKNWN